MFPLSSVYAARDQVVVSFNVAKRLVEKTKLASLGLNELENGDIYTKNANFIREYNPNSDTLIVARGDVEYDSLAGTPLSKITGSPILLVEPDNIPNPQIELLQKRIYPQSKRYKSIYILGGEEAISPSVEEELKNYGKEIVRLGGASRYETSVKIANEFFEFGGNRLPIVTSGKDPVIYSTTLANKYLSPIIYLDRPPERKSTFKSHDKVEGSISIESFRTYQAISKNFPKYSIDFEMNETKILDAWMYIQTIGFDSIAEKWSVKLNGHTLAYRTHSEPIAIKERSQLSRFDVGKYINGSNTLYIEGTEFNIGDHYYITDIYFVILYDSGEKTEYWINEGADTHFNGGSFETAKKGVLFNVYLDEVEKDQLAFNENSVVIESMNPQILENIQNIPTFSTIYIADVTDKIENSNQNSFSVGHPALSILAVTSDQLNVNPKVIHEEKDPHQTYVETFLNSEKFESFGLLYYRDSLSPI
jgi:hypothetical protein